jgi:hypothetical protein
VFHIVAKSAKRWLGQRMSIPGAIWVQRWLIDRYFGKTNTHTQFLKKGGKLMDEAIQEDDETTLKGGKYL